MARRPWKLTGVKPASGRTSGKISPLMERIKSPDDAGAGLSDDILDNAFWRTNLPQDRLPDDRWNDHLPDDGFVAALEKADRGDPEPIAQTLLNFDYDLPPLARFYLDNLIARGCVPSNLKEKLPRMSKQDCSKLRSLLRPDRDLSRAQRQVLAAAIKRGIPRPPNAPPHVAYNMSTAEGLLLIAREHYVRARHDGKSPDEAVTRVAVELGFDDEDVLRNSLERKRGAARKRKKAFDLWLNAGKRLKGKTRL